MKKKTLRPCKIILLTVFICTLFSSFAQADEIKPVSLLQDMPDFTLPVYQGGELSISQLKGKNVLIVFPRGLASKDHWCHVCNYHYADLVELEKKKQIREKLDLEILVVLPYSQDMVKEWVGAFQDQFIDIDNWKNPAEPEKLDEKQKHRVERIRRLFPNKYMYEKGKVPTPFPILIDGERIVSKGLGIFSTDWSGSKIEQNIPTVFILDKKGAVQFKYISQNTFDRPGAEYLMKFIGRLNKE
ncbi:redoxin domain-containing protein [bacterium]|nr:redoxin domain-containing protein [bacterium]